MAKGFKSGGRRKGTPNKLNSKIKEKLNDILHESLDKVDISEMNMAENLKLIQTCLQYLVQKPQGKNIDDSSDHKIEIEILDGNGYRYLK